MKKIKLILVAIAIIFSTCMLEGCVKVDEPKEDTNQKVEEKSIALTLSEQFKEEMKKEKDIKKVAEIISQNKVLQISTNVESLKKSDYLSGFQTEIKGHNKVVTIRPMISTIPFIAYIFETENAEKFAEELKSNADLRWNVCTEADDLEVTVVDNYVFFIMSPTNFEE